MPGTILVSVLEFMNLPLSSSTSIKVSFGKTEYQVSEKEDFSFPLTSLRDNIIVKLEDSDGTEISRIGFDSKSIIEKGVWEDMFPLGHGHLRLRLQFILNDEERDRIRMMRQSALKKKHGELLNKSISGADSCSTSAGTTALTSAQMMRSQNSADKYKETSSNKPLSSLAVNVSKSQEKGLTKKPDLRLRSAKNSQRAINSEEEAILFKSSEQNVVDNNQIQSNPRSVSKMISAFERQTSPSQVMRSHIKPPPTEYQSSKTETKASSKQYPGRELRVAPAYIEESRKKTNSIDHVSCKETEKLKELSTIKILNKQTDSNVRNKFKVAHKADTEEDKYNKDLMRRSTFETVTISGKIPEKHQERNNLHNFFRPGKDSISNTGYEDKRGNAFEGSYEFRMQMDSLHNLNSVEHFGDDNYCSFESSGAWIFPDEPRKVCVTTGGKIVMGLLDSLVTKQKSHQRSLDSSMLENMEKNAACIETGTDKIDEVEEPKYKNSDNNRDEISEGPVKQVIKVAIIVGFGILVLLTRQRKSR